MIQDQIVASATRALFGMPLVNNVSRAILVEAMIDSALPDAWRWCSGDWSLCDFEHKDGTRLEVKQSAARQSWHQADDLPSRGSFDIAERKSAWDGVRWVPSVGRNAEIYVFAFHPITDGTADHRDPEQWLFFVVPTSLLPCPPQPGQPAPKTIALAGVKRLADGAVRFDQLADRVETVRLGLMSSVFTRRR